MAAILIFLFYGDFVIRPVLAARGQMGGALAQGGGVPKWWLAAGVTPVAAYAPKGAASLAASYINLANPGTLDAAPGVAPTWSAASGWSFNGSTQYLTTGIIPTTNQAYSSIARYQNWTLVSGRALAGLRNGSGSRQFGLAFSGGKTQYFNGGVLEPAVSPATSGNLAVAGNLGYRNGVVESGTIGAWSDPGIANTTAIFIGARNNMGVADNFTMVEILALAVYSSTLNAAGIAAVVTAMAAL